MKRGANLSVKNIVKYFKNLSKNKKIITALIFFILLFVLINLNFALINLNNGIGIIPVVKAQASGAGAACFLPGTIIQTINGFKPIEEIKENELVLSYDKKNNKLVYSKVTKTFKHDANEYLIINDKIKVTPNHPLYINGKWSEAGNLKAGDYLFDKNKNKIKVVSIKKVKEPTDVYNLEVDNTNNYFADGILAHNKGPEAGGRPSCPTIAAGCYNNAGSKVDSGSLTPRNFGAFYSDDACTGDSDTCGCSLGVFAGAVKQEDPDASVGACGCISGASWDITGKCCGDDAADCGNVAGGYLCSSDPNFRLSPWIPSSGDKKGDIVHLECTDNEFLSDGSTWQRCNNDFWQKSVEGSDYICSGTGRESIAECCADNSCNSDENNGKRLSIGESVATLETECVDGDIRADGYSDKICHEGSFYSCSSGSAGTIRNINNADGFDAICVNAFPPWNSWVECNSNNIQERLGQNGVTMPQGTVYNIDGYGYLCHQNSGFESWIGCNVDLKVEGSKLETGQKIGNYVCCGDNKWHIGDCASNLAPSCNQGGIEPKTLSFSNFSNTDWGTARFNCNDGYGLNGNVYQFFVVTTNCGDFDERYAICAGGDCKFKENEKDIICRGWAAPPENNIRRQVNCCGLTNCPSEINWVLYDFKINPRKCSYGSETRDCCYAIYKSAEPCPATEAASCTPSETQIQQFQFQCGNNICEPGENQDNCQADCIEATYYCRSDSVFVTDLDTPNSEISNSELSNKNQQTCEAAGFNWTGTKCCSEADDGSEYYNDEGGIGGCWNKKIVLTGEKVPSRENILNLDGVFYGCGITNNNVLSIADKHTNEQLIENKEYCDDLEGYYYCATNNTWQPPHNINRSHFSAVPEGLNVDKQSECCQPTNCWNGSSCVQSVANSPVGGVYNGYRCINGLWNQAQVVYTPDQNSSGYCPSSSQCLVDLQGDAQDNNNTEGNPQCIATSQYIEDNYCENGVWSSRTKYIALQLADIPKNDYILFCGNYEEALNYLKYTLNNKYAKDYVVGKTNNYCILSYDGKVVFGTSLNQEINTGDYKFMDVIGTSCGNAMVDDGKYHQCSTKKAWYNKKLKSIIYSKDPIELAEFNLFERFASFLGNPFAILVDTLKQKIAQPYDQSFVKGVKSFKSLYINKKGNKFILGAMEGTQYRNIVIEYKNFDTDICKIVDAYNAYNSDGMAGVLCSKEGKNYYVLAQGNMWTAPDPANIWSDLTSKLRIN